MFPNDYIREYFHDFKIRTNSLNKSRNQKKMENELNFNKRLKLREFKNKQTKKKKKEKKRNSCGMGDNSRKTDN